MGVLVLSLGLVAMASLGPAAPATAVEEVCVDGFSRVEPTRLILPEDVYSSRPNKALVAGGAPAPDSTRRASIAHFKSAGGWKRLISMSLGRDSGFLAVSGTVSARPWAVGYGQDYAWLSPLVARARPDGTWRRVTVPKPSANAALTDVSVTNARKTWAVGFRLKPDGSPLPWALRWSGGKWSSRSPGLRSAERGTLTGVSALPGGGTWVAGSVFRAGVERFYLAQRVGGKWKRRDLDRFGSGALSAILVPSGGSGWAVGYRRTANGPRALVLRRDGGSWVKVAPPATDGATVLLDVSVGADGRVAVSGTAWRNGAGRMRGFVAERNGSGWDVHYTKLSGADMALTGTAGDPSADGWAVGRDLVAGVAARSCTPDPVTVASRKQKRTVRRERRAGIARASAATAGDLHPAELPPAPRPDLEPAPRLRIAAAGGVAMRDRAGAVGLPTKGMTYGAVIRDFDGNGRKDIFLGGHAGPATLFLRKGGSFKAHPEPFERGDRHGCDSADVDGSGLPDLYCSYGSGRGLGTKSNQLWLDPGGAGRQRVDDAGGAVSPLGRGRAVTFIDVNADGRKDLVLGQQSERLDGLPSSNAVYLRDGKASFRHVGAYGLSPFLATRSFDTGDVDRDGRTDLLMVYISLRASGSDGGVRLFRSTARGFRNVTGAYGIRNMGERDAELVRLDRDARPDLIQLSGDRIRISLQRGGRFVKVYERRISKAGAIATGDADGDGDRDIYVLRNKDSKAIKDLVLFNRGDGRSYRAVAAPSRPGGSADDVYPIDHDGNGLTDFLVLNGRYGTKGPGSIQLISFYR